MMIGIVQKLSIGLILSLLLVVTPVLAADVVVTPIDPQGWFAKQGNVNATGSIADVADSHGGTGSFEFNLQDVSDNSGSIFQIARIPAIRIDQVTEVGWEFRSDSTNSKYPVVKIEYYGSGSNGNIIHSGSLVYLFSGAVTPGAWQTVSVDLDNDLWWSTEFGSGVTHTLSEWQNLLGDIPVNYFFAGIGSTSGNPGAATCYIDYIHLKADRANGPIVDTTWDFEHSGDLPPEPPDGSIPTLSEWGFIIMALLLSGVAVLRIRESNSDLV